MFQVAGFRPKQISRSHRAAGHCGEPTRATRTVDGWSTCGWMRRHQDCIGADRPFEQHEDSIKLSFPTALVRHSYGSTEERVQESFCPKTNRRSVSRSSETTLWDASPKLVAMEMLVQAEKHKKSGPFPRSLNFLL